MKPTPTAANRWSVWVPPRPPSLLSEPSRIEEWAHSEGTGPRLHSIGGGSNWSSSSIGQESPDWGLLANESVDRQPMKSVFFFAGNWRSQINTTQFYEQAATPNDRLYTIHPADPRHLGWSERPEYRALAVDMMIAAKANVITMSYWGERGTDRWAHWAPMQVSTMAHDELFTETIGKPVLIMPAIESSNSTLGRSCNGNSSHYHFSLDFPGPESDPAPKLVSQIKDLLHRYVTHPANPAWPRQWVQMYDRNGNKRYAIHVLHVASALLGPDEHEAFAHGFDRVADKVFQEMGVRVGFTLDLLPRSRAVQFTDCPQKHDSWFNDSYVPSAQDTGPLLRQQSSMLAVQGFIPEIWLGIENERSLVEFKRAYLEGWMAQGLPVILDLSPGYDARFVFHHSLRYGNNAGWRNELSQLRTLHCKGITFNTWNGYTEGYAAVPTTQYGDIVYRWLQQLFTD